MPRKTFKKNITEGVIDKINPKNVEITKRFLKDKSSRCSEKTIESYECDLNIFFSWNFVNNSDKFFIDIKKLEFSDFISYATTELKWGALRTNRVRSVLSSLSTFIEKFFDDEYPDFRNVILKVIESTPKDQRREKTILSNEQVESLLNHLSETDKQKACWLSLAVTSGARFSETLRFTTDLIDENRRAFGDLFLETTKQIKTKGRGRGGKLLYKYILAEAFLPYYNNWLIERKAIIEKSGIEDHFFLFINDDGTPAEDYVVRNWFVGFEKFLGVSVYPHAFRHYTTTLLSKKNIPPMLIKELMGWSSVNMVEIYDDQTAKDREWSGLESLKI